MRRLTSITAAAVFGLLVGTAASQAQAPTQLIHPTTQQWRYLADNTDQGTAWSGKLFDDSTWPTGTALFGNDAGYPFAFATTIAGPSTGGPLVCYFRTKFNWAGGTMGVILTGTNYIDDGDVVYLNGVEVTRFNMPAGAPTFATLAPAANPGGFPNINGGEPVVVTMQISLDALTNGNSNPLVVGENTLAVEVHNQGTGSSDTVFGMALYASQAIAPCTDNIQPTNRTVTACRNTTFTVVQPPNCGIPSPTIQWFRNVGGVDEAISGANGASLTLSNLTTADQGQYFAVLNNGVGSPATSHRAVLTVTADTQGPRVNSAVFAGGPGNEVIVTFNEDITDASGTDTFEYAIVSQDGFDIPGISGAIRDTANFSIVHLTLDRPLTQGVRYNYTIGTEVGIVDACAGNTSIGLTGTVLIQAVILTADDPVKTWRYDDTAVDRGTNWKDIGYDDSSWKSGPAVFDAKDVPRAAVSGLNVGTQLQRRIVGTPFETVNLPTIYLRTHINIPAGTLGVSMRSVADDAYVLYVNGVEVSRLRAPVANDPFANYSGGGTVGDGNYEGPVTIPNSVLNIGGDNVFAVLLKQNDATSSDITWGMELTALVPGVEVNPPSILTQPASVTATEGHSFSLSVVASGTTPLTYQWYHGANAIQGANAATYTKVNAAAGDAGNYHVNVSNSALPAGVDSAAATVTIRPVAVSYTATWRYETNSQDATLATATPWYATAFNDSTWQSGSGLFGLETTAGTVGRLPAAIATGLPAPAATYITTYFRSTVNVPALTAGQSLALFHTIDDGAAFYVDGVLALRYNLTNNPPIYSTNVAPAAVPGDGDAMIVSQPVSLPAGQHTVAVEVHQNAATSSDVVFGAELRVVNAGTAPTLTVAHPTPTSVTVTWTPNAQYSLYQATVITGPFLAVGGNPQGTYTVANIVPDAARFFQVRMNGQ